MSQPILVQQTKRVTITEVAKEAGVSQATVSLVLNGKGRISERTRKRVNAVAKRLGFVRDQTAASLRSGKSQLIGTIVHDMSNPFHAEFIAGVEATVSSGGYLTIVSDSGDDPARQRDLLAAMASHGVAGLIVSPSVNTRFADFDPLQAANIPLVTAVRRLVGFHADYVGPDNRAGARLVTAALCALGHRRIAFVGGLPATQPWRRRKSGIQAELARYGAALEKDNVLPGRASREFGREAVDDILRRHSLPTAIFCYNDIVALGVCGELARRGLRVPDDISVVGFDNLAESQFAVPSLTTVELFPRDLGARAAEKLLLRLAGDVSPPQLERLTPELVTRGSIAAPPRAMSPRRDTIRQASPGHKSL